METEELDEALLLTGETTDSAEADSLLILPKTFTAVYRPFDPLLDTARIDKLTTIDTYYAQADTLVAERPLPPAWEEGLVPEDRAVHPGNFSAFLLVLTVLFVVLAFNFHSLKRLLKVYADELIKIRHGRDNVFDDRPAGDIRIMIVLIITFIVSAGILMAGAVSEIDYGDPGSINLVDIVYLTALTGGYYLFEYVAYQTVGYTFAGSEGRREWVRGFNASQALLGVVMVIPAIMVVFYPVTTNYMLIAGLIFYFAARILFIIKGFRIFYDKITSFLYFILYLCTLEIIPLILVYKCSVSELV